MWGGGLPAWYEVVDAELMGILAYLQEVEARAKEAAGQGAAGRRCLVMSDCKGALELVEWAWRRGGTRGMERHKRGGILEAICRVRARLGLVVTMYIPAHRGSSMSAYADAAAKTSLEKGMEEAEAEWLREKRIEERVGREFGYELRGGDGVVAPWHDAIFGMAREATGAWVRAREAGRVRTGAAATGTVLVDTASKPLGW